MTRILVLWITLLGLGQSVRAWDYEQHRFVNQMALAALPTNFPGWALTPEARERVAFLAGEADRWRNTPEAALKHHNGPDHYLDFEDLALHQLDGKNLTQFRYEFTAQLALSRAAHATNFPPIDQARNSDKTRELAGYLPWTITEYYAKLKSQFSYLREYEENGTSEEIANARQNIVYIMGVMGHFVADATQPLHTTKHFNGWVGPNPQGYTTDNKFHSWIDGGYLEKTGLDKAAILKQVQPARSLRENGRKADDLFPEVMAYFLEQHQLVEPLYQLQKEGKLSGTGATGLEGREFLTRQLLKSGQMLGSLWLTAWQQAGPDKFLKDHLLKRKAAGK